MDSKFVFRKDPCGIICLLITYGCVFYCDYCVVDHVIRPTLSARYAYFVFKTKLVVSNFVIYFIVYELSYILGILEVVIQVLAWHKGRHCHGQWHCDSPKSTQTNN